MVDDIAVRLEDLGEDRARFVASFAMVLARAARADLEVSEEERGAIIDALRTHLGMTGEQPELVADMVAHRSELLGASQDYLATRELRDAMKDADRAGILHCLFAVCAADDSISLVEEEEVRQVASELGFSQREYTDARAEFRQQREVLRGLPDAR